MLSRAAERIYWAGRYLERAENTARIVQQYSQLLLDLPEEAGVDWTELLRIFGVTDAAIGNRSERSIVNTLLADSASACSLRYALAMARENIRNSRDLLPQEAWERMNELSAYAGAELALAAAGSNRFEVLSDCIGACQQINGILHGTMSHAHPFRFLVLGQNIERADMTSRVVDVAALYIEKNERLVLRYGSTLWTNVLKSVSAFQMYRQTCQPQVQSDRVVRFLLFDTDFPRAVAACLGTARTAAAALPHCEAAVAAIDEAQRFAGPDDVDALDAPAVRQLMDRLQICLASVNDAVRTTWFGYPVAPT